MRRAHAFSNSNASQKSRSLALHERLFPSLCWALLKFVLRYLDREKHIPQLIPHLTMYTYRLFFLFDDCAEFSTTNIWSQWCPSSAELSRALCLASRRLKAVFRAHESPKHADLEAGQIPSHLMKWEHLLTTRKGVSLCWFPTDPEMGPRKLEVLAVKQRQNSAFGQILSKLNRLSGLIEKAVHETAGPRR